MPLPPMAIHDETFKIYILLFGILFGYPFRMPVAFIFILFIYFLNCEVVVKRTQHGGMHIWKIHKIIIGSNVIFVGKYQMEVFIGSSNILLGVTGMLLLVQNVHLKLEKRLENT